MENEWVYFAGFVIFVAGVMLGDRFARKRRRRGSNSDGGGGDSGILVSGDRRDHDTSDGSGDGGGDGGGGGD